MTCFFYPPGTLPDTSSTTKFLTIACRSSVERKSRKAGASLLSAEVLLLWRIIDAARCCKRPVDMPRRSYHICTLTPSSRETHCSVYGDLQAISHNTFVGNLLLHRHRKRNEPRAWCDWWGNTDFIGRKKNFIFQISEWYDWWDHPGLFKSILDRWHW